MTSQLYHSIFSEMFTFREVKDDKILFNLLITGELDPRFYFSSSGNFHLSGGLHIPTQLLEESYNLKSSEYWAEFPVNTEVPIEEADKWDPMDIGSCEEDDWGHYYKLNAMVNVVLMYDQTMEIKMGDNLITRFESVEVRRLVELSKQIKGIETRYPGILDSMNLGNYEISEVSIEKLVLSHKNTPDNKLTFEFKGRQALHFNIRTPEYSITNYLDELDSGIKSFEEGSTEEVVLRSPESVYRIMNLGGVLSVVVDTISVDTLTPEFLKFVSDTGHKIHDSWEATTGVLLGVHKNSLVDDLITPSVSKDYLWNNFIELSSMDGIKFYYDYPEIIFAVTREDLTRDKRYGVKLSRKFLNQVMDTFDDHKYKSDMEPITGSPENVESSIFEDNLILNRDIDSSLNVILRKSDIETLLSHKPKK